MTAEDVYEMLRKIRYDLTNAQGKLTDVFRMLGELNLQDTPTHVCERCGAPFRASTLLAEHVYHSHGGPEPEHWLALEALIDPGAERSDFVASTAFPLPVSVLRKEKE